MIKKLFVFSTLLAGNVFGNVDIPTAIKVPEGHKAYLSVYGEGVQIYQCTLNESQYNWQIQAPNAQLFDQTGAIVGKHFKGPVWEYKEGSRVQGKIMERLDIAKGVAIPWLLVKVVGHKGESIFTRADYIIRINTQGGLAPQLGCDGNHLGSEKQVPYSADYVFYESN